MLLLVVKCTPFGGEDLGSRSNGKMLGGPWPTAFARSVRLLVRALLFGPCRPP